MESKVHVSKHHHHSKHQKNMNMTFVEKIMDEKTFLNVTYCVKKTMRCFSIIHVVVFFLQERIIYNVIKIKFIVK